MPTDFDLADVLTVTTGILIPPADMGAVYRVLSFLVGYDVYTHQIPEALRVARPWILERYPHLGQLRPTDEERAAWSTDESRSHRWITLQRHYLGDRLSLSPMPANRVSSAFGDPVGSLVAMVGKDRVVVVEAEGEA